MWETKHLQYETLIAQLSRTEFLIHVTFVLASVTIACLITKSTTLTTITLDLLRQRWLRLKSRLRLRRFVVILLIPVGWVVPSISSWCVFGCSRIMRLVVCTSGSWSWAGLNVLQGLRIVNFSCMLSLGRLQYELLLFSNHQVSH